MKIYISGILGTGMGPLALMAKSAGYDVVGSDRNGGLIADELKEAGIDFRIGQQDGNYLEETQPDWFVYTSALPEDHPELVRARANGIRCSKRDELIAFLVKELNLKMVAVAGTHGKTTTTSMLVWAAEKLGLKASYLVGTTLGFAKSGRFVSGDRYFIYEADEYDRNFLHFSPWLSIITYVSYDHPDIYKTESEYREAFAQFESQSQNVIKNTGVDNRITLAGKARREDATMAMLAIKQIAEDEGVDIDEQTMIEILNAFPGVGRRFERLADGIYSDYAHHPEEIAATIEMANEEAIRTNKKGVVVLYEPHQNTRQHEVRAGYKSVFNGAARVFWLPTYLTREDQSLAIISPEEFINDLEFNGKCSPAELGPELANEIAKYKKDGYLVLLMTAGPADGWLRSQISDML